MAKGKTISFDPRKDKRLMIFTSRTFPSWQQKYIDIVSEAFDGLSIDMKAVSARVTRMGEAKKAMPFVQALKRKIDNSAVMADTESDNNKTASKAANDVFNRTLPFDEHEILKAMAPGLKQTLQKCRGVEIILVDNDNLEGGKSTSASTPAGSAENENSAGDGITGILIAGDDFSSTEANKRRTNLPPVALSAEPGTPTFYFENV